MLLSNAIYFSRRESPMTHAIVGKCIVDVPISQGNSLENEVRVLAGRNKAMFLDSVRGMLAGRREDRKTAWELLENARLKSWEIDD